MKNKIDIFKHQKILIFIIFLCTFIGGYAHPHVFFEVEYTINVKDNSELNLNLTLDEMNSEIIKNGDIDKDFSDDILKDLHIYHNGKIVKNTFISKNAEFINKCLVIHLTLQLPKLNKSDKLLISLYDKEYFFDYDYSLNSFKVNSEQYISRSNFKENKKKAYYFNSVYPKEYELQLGE